MRSSLASSSLQEGYFPTFWQQHWIEGLFPNFIFLVNRCPRKKQDLDDLMEYLYHDQEHIPVIDGGRMNRDAIAWPLWGICRAYFDYQNNEQTLSVKEYDYLYKNTFAIGKDIWIHDVIIEFEPCFDNWLARRRTF